MKKITFILSFLFAFSTIGYSQVSGYGFTETTETYAQITGTTSTATGDDGTQTNIPIGFIFNFGGVDYTAFGISTNGIIRLGSSAANTTIGTGWVNELISSAPNRPLIAPFWDDNHLSTGTIRYSLTGSAPNQVLTVNWHNMKVGGGGSTAGASVSMLLRLYETTNIIEIVYDSPFTTTNAVTASVGLNDMTSFLSVTPAVSSTVSSATANNGITAAGMANLAGKKLIFSPPSCPGPTNIVVSNVTTNSADFSWTAGGSEFDWEYLILPAGSPAPTGSGIDIDTDSFTDSGLSPATAYAFWVRAYCSFSDQSSWVGPFNFITPCLPLTSIPHNESFDAAAIPVCWSTALVTGATNWAPATNNDGVPAARTGARFAGKSWVGNDDALLISPVYDLSAFPTQQVRLNVWIYRNTVGLSTDRVSFYVNTENNLTGAVDLIDVPLPISSAPVEASAGWYNYIAEIPLSYNTGGNFYIIARGRTSSSFSSYGIGFDDYRLEFVPLAPPSCATNVVATPNATCGNFANAITWDVTSGADGYYVTIGTTSGGSDIANAVNVAVPSYNFTGTVNTTYYYTIVPYNTNGSAVGCTEQSFTTNANGCYCVPSSASTATYVNNFSTTGGSQNISNLSTGFTAGGYLDASAQFVESFPTSSFNFNAAIVGGTAGFSIWVDWNNDLIFDNATEKVFNTTGYGNGPFTGTITIPVGTPIGNYRMRITTDWNAQNPSNPCAAAARAEFEDYTISVIAPPSCVAPSALNVTAITAATASLGWTENGTATSWDVEWGTLGFTPTGTPTVSGASNPEAISGLSPNTAYSFYVRANCGIDGFSTWSGPFNFTTSCVADDVPYSQNFESATVPNLPACTSQQNVGTGNLWTVANNPGYGFTTNVLRYGWNSANAANVWFYTNGVNLVGGTTYRISYDYGCAGASFPERLRVSYGSSASAASMTDLLAEHPNVVNNVTPINNVVEFTPGTSGVYYFGFNAYSVADQFYLFVDNILVEVALSSNTFDNNNFMVYPNPVKDILNLSYTSEISTVRVMNMLGQEVISRKLNSANAQVDMSQLSAGTYIVNVTIGDTVKTIKVVKQ